MFWSGSLVLFSVSWLGFVWPWVVGTPILYICMHCVAYLTCTQIFFFLFLFFFFCFCFLFPFFFFLQSHDKNASLRNDQFNIVWGYQKLKHLQFLRHGKLYNYFQTLNCGSPHRVYSFITVLVTLAKFQGHSDTKL